MCKTDPANQIGHSVSPRITLCPCFSSTCLNHFRCKVLTPVNNRQTHLFFRFTPARFWARQCHKFVTRSRFQSLVARCPCKGPRNATSKFLRSHLTLTHQYGPNRLTCAFSSVIALQHRPTHPTA